MRKRKIQSFLKYSFIVIFFRSLDIGGYVKKNTDTLPKNLCMVACKITWFYYASSFLKVPLGLQNSRSSNRRLLLKSFMTD
eukprot:snap_masked-scaffold_37-processed-gene-2.80-mRNA-1 protein AED:1.00 eAED:1.00 QI:0/0/0/0/1/1/2/0/80